MYAPKTVTSRAISCFPQPAHVAGCERRLGTDCVHAATDSERNERQVRVVSFDGVSTVALETAVDCIVQAVPSMNPIRVSDRLIAGGRCVVADPKGRLLIFDLA